MGIPVDSPQRLQAGIQYTLSEAAGSGHCFLPEPNLLADAAQILQAADLVRVCLDDLAVTEGVIREPIPNPTTDGGAIPAVYLVPFHHAETALAAALRSGRVAARAGSEDIFRSTRLGSILSGDHAKGASDERSGRELAR